MSKVVVASRTFQSAGQGRRAMCTPPYVDLLDMVFTAIE